jgi:hypothetical protein
LVLFTREKWTLFEEATRYPSSVLSCLCLCCYSCCILLSFFLARVPLFISHPQSPFKGQHYKYPVESIDVYATLNELLKLPKPRESVCEGVKCKPLQGKSLGPVVLGAQVYEKLLGGKKEGIFSTIKSFISSKEGSSASSSASSASGLSSEMPVLEHNFALSQAVRCASYDKVKDHVATRYRHGANKAGEGSTSHKAIRSAYWNDCDVTDKRKDKEDFTTLGYSMRTPEYRYTVYFLFNRTTQLPELDKPPFEEELYDHKNETLADFTHRETYNLAVKALYGPIMDSLRQKLVRFIKENIKFGNH